MKNNNKRGNSLFALEQKLFGNFQQQSHQPEKKELKQPQKEARAFDFGEAIELPYNSTVFDRDEAIELKYGDDDFSSETPEAMSFSAPNSFALELEDESLPEDKRTIEVDKSSATQEVEDRDKAETKVKGRDYAEGMMNNGIEKPIQKKTKKSKNKKQLQTSRKASTRS